MINLYYFVVFSLLAASGSLDAIRAIQDKSIKTFALAIFATRMLSRL